MSEGDLLADRKRLKRGIGTWRGLAILALAVAGVLVAQQYGPHSAKKAGGLPGKGYIAEIKVESIIADDADRDALLKDILEDDDAKALIVSLDSPGGTTFGGEELYLQLKKIGTKKPVVGVMRTLCASACYMASLGTEQVFARNSTLTGSIGVLLESVEVSKLADKLGINPITITSGKYKDVPSLTRPMNDDEREMLHSSVMEAYEQFVDLVATRRGLSPERVRELADGRVYSGKQALPIDLIDGIGGIEEAKAWLVSEKKLSDTLEIELVEPEPKYESLLGRLSQWTGIEIFGKRAMGLDGLISIWQHSPVQ